MGGSVSEKKPGSEGFASMLRLGITLAVFAVVSCTVLALVNNLTLPVITRNNIRKANAAMQAVFAPAQDFAEYDKALPASRSGKTSIDSLKIAKAGDKVLGAVVQISGPTYDRSTIMFGVDASGIVTGMRYLNNTDTPGFGQKGSDPSYRVKSGVTFYEQFTGMDSKAGFTAGQTFDSISGATITSNGIAVMMDDACAAVKEALETLDE